MGTKKYLPVLMLILLGSCNKYDIQPEQAEGFLKFFSGTLTERAYDVKQAADGGFIAVGTTTGEDGLRDIYLVKTDAYGNEESWSPVTIGGLYDDLCASLRVLPDGYLILGSSKAADTSDYDMYLVKTDLQGSVSWERRSGDPGDDIGTSLVITSEGDYLAAGTKYDPVLGKNNYKVARFRAGDETIQHWVIYPDQASSAITAYIVEAQDHFVICGTEDNGSDEDIQIIPIDKTNLRPLGGRLYESGDLRGNCIQELSDGNLLFCGTWTDPQTGLGSICIQKVSPSLGTLQGWDEFRLFKEIGDNASLTGNQIRVVGEDRYAVIGTRTETGNDDMILLHTDANGGELSRRIFGDEGFQQGVSLEVTADGGLILVGNNGSEDNSMMALVRTDEEGNF
jgi:hypothetical protein